MTKARGAPTLQDVARRAGVHPATVSRALNRPSMVAPATREAVAAAVDALGFVPNPSAQRLAGGRAEAVGVVVPDITNPYFATVLQAIQTAASGEHLAVLIADSGADPQRESHILETLSRWVDGLVVCTPVTDLSAATVPIVQVNRQAQGVPSVVVDQAEIVRLALEHLVELGHRRVAYLHGPLRYWSTRRRTHALQRLGCERRGDVDIATVHPVPGTFAGGQAVLDAVRATGATGVLAFNDVQAAGLLDTARTAGLDVPGDLSIVGSDGLDLAAMTSPALTTVTAPLHQIGSAAFARLVADEPMRQRIMLAPTLTVGKTTGPAPVSPGRTRSLHAQAG